MLNAIPIVESKNENIDEKKYLKRTDLPVYSEVSQVTENSEEKTDNEYILQAVKLLRMEACKLVHKAQSISDRCSQFFNTGFSHAYSNYLSTIEFLHEERNILPRFGAIGGGILCGYVFGLRKGSIKRFLYTTIGGLSVGAICYPEEAENYYQQSAQVSKKYFIIGYHFMNGVTKDLTGIELPVLPSKTMNHDNESR